MARSMRNKVIVITGASSGIGRATARALAAQGAKVVLAARDKDALQSAARECEAAGGEAHFVVTDVTDENAVEELAQEAEHTFGPIDAWVNNAAVTLFGRFDETPSEAWRQVIETNLFGYVNGARTVLPRFREQGRGVLVNVDSVAGVIGQPYVSAYVASKHAIRGLGMSLRQELQLAGAKKVHVSTVLPPTVDTPLFQHAANYTGRTVQAMPPVYPPEEVAETIIGAIMDPQPEISVGAAGAMLVKQQQSAPEATEKMMARMVDKEHLGKDVGLPATPGNLFRPLETPHDVHGGWMYRNEKSPFRRAARGAAVAGAVALAAGGAWWAYQNAAHDGNGHKATGLPRTPTGETPGDVLMESSAPPTRP